jgi:hypothetical protein
MREAEQLDNDVRTVVREATRQPSITVAAVCHAYDWRLMRVLVAMGAALTRGWLEHRGAGVYGVPR